MDRWIAIIKVIGNISEFKVKEKLPRSSVKMEAGQWFPSTR